MSTPPPHPTPIQNAVMVEDAKANLRLFAADVEAEKQARGAVGSMVGKTVIAGAAAALLVGVLIGKPIGGVLRSKISRRSSKADWLKGSVAGLVGGVKSPKPRSSKLGLAMKLAKPLVPLAAQMAGRWYLKHQAAKRAAVDTDQP